MRDNAGDRLVPLPDTGRVHRSARRAYVGDCGADGRVRLDALARFLQDAAGDDAADAEDPSGPGWVVRRTVVEVATMPRLREDVELATFCGGTGRRWAERRTSITGSSGAAVEAASLWINVDFATGRPVALPEGFFEAYGGLATARQVTARQRHALEVPTGAALAPWQVRLVDLDLLDHVNNAVGWAVLEEARALAGDVGAGGLAGRRAEVEYRRSLGRDDDVALVWAHVDGGRTGAPSSLRCWLVTAEAAARVAGDGGTVAADEVFVTGTLVPLAV